MEKSKIYTKKGDEGFTSLATGKRVPKTDPRLEAYGTVDELNSFIACLLEEVYDPDDVAFLTEIQSELFTLGAYLASENGKSAVKIDESSVLKIEAEIDKIDSQVPPLKAFVLPGGSKGNAFAHVCRTVCRRAERNIYHLNSEENIDGVALRYVNRLSDYFFILARKQNILENIPEKIWKNP
jgi:cob(I)alamin adenosyltransferase